MPAADTYPERKCIIMPFTPISHAEYDRVKSAKKQAFLWLADNFFTVYFAFILCFLPCLFIAVIWRGTSFFLTAEVFFGFLTVFSLPVAASKLSFADFTEPESAASYSYRRQLSRAPFAF